MYDLKQSDVSRAIDILRHGPLSAADFSMRMWPDRTNHEGKPRSHGSHSLAGNAFLYRLGSLGYVEKVGDLWMVRRISAGSPGSPVSQPASTLPGYSPGYPPGYPAWIPAASPPSYSQVDPAAVSSVESAERTRLVRLVELAVDPVATVTHDAAFGDIKVRSIHLDGAIVEACAIVVLLGRSTNVYPPCSAPQMLVGLAPAEAARALFLRWSQSGHPPELPREGAWIRVPDGIVASSSYWRPAGAPESWVDPEDVRVRVQRQRVAAGLA
jgi:hypothetical protein